MAYKSFRSLTPRNQSSLVTQLHKLINYYGEIFCPRERTYIKSLTQHDGSVYWLEDDVRKIIAVAIIDPNYSFKLNDFDVKVLGHTISKRPGQMDRILHHIWSDYEDDTIAIVCRKSLTSAFDVSDLNLVELTSLEISENWTELADYRTNYFNLSDERVSDGLNRKDYCIFVKFTDKDLASLKDKNEPLFNLVTSKIKQRDAAVA